MPQLDFIIVFPQIFWFFLIFISFYFFVINYFLPKFLKSLKLRKYILNFNFIVYNNLLENNRNLKLNFLNKLILNLTNLKFSLYLSSSNLNFFFKKNKYLNTIKFDSYFINLLKNKVVFCNSLLLNSILLYPSNLNLK